PVPTVTEYWPMLPEALNPVMAKAMAKGPDDRYQSAHELTQAVAEALGTSVLAGPVVTRSAESGATGAGHGFRLVGTSSRLSFWRKLGILAQWGGRRLRGPQPDKLKSLLGGLFPARQRLNRGQILAGVLIVLVGVMVSAALLNGRAPTAPASTATSSAA